jgi:hypothetical protein
LHPLSQGPSTATGIASLTKNQYKNPCVIFTCYCFNHLFIKSLNLRKSLNPKKLIEISISYVSWIFRKQDKLVRRSGFSFSFELQVLQTPWLPLNKVLFWLEMYIILKKKKWLFYRFKPLYIYYCSFCTYNFLVNVIFPYFTLLIKGNFKYHPV